MSTAPPEIIRSRSEILATAKKMLTGRCSYIEGSRTINALAHEARLERLEEPFVSFVAIDSETDEVPVGRVRELWHPEARAKLMPEWDEAERWAQQYGEEACHRAIALLSNNDTDDEAITL